MALAYGGHVYMGPLALRLNDLTYISIAQMYVKSLNPSWRVFQIFEMYANWEQNCLAMRKRGRAVRRFRPSHKRLAQNWQKYAL